MHQPRRIALIAWQRHRLAQTILDKDWKTNNPYLCKNCNASEWAHNGCNYLQTESWKWCAFSLSIWLMLV